MKILLIGNKGSLYDCCVKKMSLLYDVDSFCIVKAPLSNLPFDLSAYKNSVIFKNYDAIVYISGETRDLDFMHLLNFRFPSELIDIAYSLKIPFFYLSSLAIYGRCFDDTITTKSKFAPIDTYGFTKCLLDQYVGELRKIDHDVKIKAILPASIYSGRGRSSLEKFEYLKIKFRLIFNFFTFQGCISYIEQDKLVDTIVASVGSENYRFEILSFHFEFSQCKGWFIFPKPPIWFFKMVDFMSPAVSLRLRILLRGIRYN